MAVIRDAWTPATAGAGYLQLRQGVALALVKQGDALLRAGMPQHSAQLPGTDWTIEHWLPSSAAGSWVQPGPAAAAVFFWAIAGLVFWHTQRRDSSREETLDASDEPVLATLLSEPAQRHQALDAGVAPSAADLFPELRLAAEGCPPDAQEAAPPPPSGIASGGSMIAGGDGELPPPADVLESSALPALPPTGSGHIQAPPAREIELQDALDDATGVQRETAAETAFDQSDDQIDQIPFMDDDSPMSVDDGILAGTGAEGGAEPISVDTPGPQASGWAEIVRAALMS
jgi:hypothetical protein